MLLVKELLENRELLTDYSQSPEVQATVLLYFKETTSEELELGQSGEGVVLNHFRCMADA